MFVRCIRSRSARSNVAIGPRIMMVAVFTTTSTPPKAASTASNAALIALSSATSPPTARARPPAAVIADTVSGPGLVARVLHGDRETVLGEPLGHGTADAAEPPGDQRDAVGDWGYSWCSPSEPSNERYVHISS
ncbi:hypothetical protein SALBM311S_00302 [Streptomyces alboniger]